MTKPMARLGKPLHVLRLLPPKDVVFASAPGCWMWAGMRNQHCSGSQGPGGHTLVPELVPTEQGW